MFETDYTLTQIISQVEMVDVKALRAFLFDNPSRPLIATGSGGCESSGNYLALLYGIRGGVATAVTPYTLNSLSDSALQSAKLVLISKGGRNNDAVAATRRFLKANPAETAIICFSNADTNESLQLMRKAGAPHTYIYPLTSIHEGFVSTGTVLAYFTLLTRVFQPEVNLNKYKKSPEVSYTLCQNSGSALSLNDFREIENYTLLYGSWGRPVAWNLENKLVESGLAPASVYDYRNYCHGRFIWTSSHLADSAMVLFVSPRERAIVARTRKFLPATTKLILIETEHDAPETSLDLLIRAEAFFRALSQLRNINYERPANPGRIDKRIPIHSSSPAQILKDGILCI